MCDIAQARKEAGGGPHAGGLALGSGIGEGQRVPYCSVRPEGGPRAELERSPCVSAVGGCLSAAGGDLSERLRRWGRGDPLGLPLTCWKGGHGWPVGVATAQGEMGSGQGEYWPV